MPVIDLTKLHLMVKIMTSDGELVEVEKEVAQHSLRIRGIIEESGACLY